MEDTLKCAAAIFLKIPHPWRTSHIQPAGTTHMLMAGLYRIEESGDTKFPHFVILTRDAAEEISFIHDRMPVMLDPAQPLPASFFANDTLADRHSF